MTSRLRETLGLPHVARRRSVLAAAVIDSLGSGLFLPFAVVYFLHTTPLSLATVGLGLSAGSALVIPLVPVAGLAVDRFGASRSVVAANLLQMTGFVGYLWVDTLWQLVAFALLVAAGRRLFWTANGAFVQLVADTGERARWFGLLRALRNGGYGVGGALASLALGVASQAAYHGFVLLNAASFLAAGLLVAAWSRRQPTATPPMTQKPTGGQSRGEPHPHRRRAGYRAVLADRVFLLLLATSFLFVLCSLVIDVLLTVYVTTTLHRPAWLAGLLFTLSGILVVTTQTMVTRRTERHPHTRVLQLAAALWGVSFVLMWAAATAPAPVVVPGLVAATLCFTAAESLAMPTLNDLVVTLAPAGRQGRYFAMQGLTWIVPQTIAPAAFTWLLDHGTGWPWVTLLLGCGASAAALSRLRRTLPITPPSPAQPEGQ